MTGKPRECIHSAASRARGEVIWRLWLQEKAGLCRNVLSRGLAQKGGASRCWVTTDHDGVRYAESLGCLMYILPMSHVENLGPPSVLPLAPRHSRPVPSDGRRETIRAASSTASSNS